MNWKKWFLENSKKILMIFLIIQIIRVFFALIIFWEESLYVVVINSVFILLFSISLFAIYKDRKIGLYISILMCTINLIGDLIVLSGFGILADAATIQETVIELKSKKYK